MPPEPLLCSLRFPARVVWWSGSTDTLLLAFAGVIISFYRWFSPNPTGRFTAPALAWAAFKFVYSTSGAPDEISLLRRIPLNSPSSLLDW